VMIGVYDAFGETSAGVRSAALMERDLTEQTRGELQKSPFGPAKIASPR